MVGKADMKRKRMKNSYHRIVYLSVAGGIFVAIFLFFTGRAAYKTWTAKKMAAVPTPSVNPYQDASLFVRPTFLPTPKEDVVAKSFKIPVIMYHYVEYVQDRHDTIRMSLNTNPALFESQLKQLKDAGYASYFARDIPDLLDGKKYYTSKMVILTFDDGYEDFYTDVFPLLKKYNMRATAYIISDFIGRRGFMNKEQLQELSRSGLVEIGSHTLDHLYLKTTPDKEAKRQIVESKKLLEKELDMPIDSFAYPFGAMSPAAIEYVKEARYTNAVSVIHGSLQSPENLFFLYRIRPGTLPQNAFVSGIEELKK